MAQSKQRKSSGLKAAAPNTLSPAQYMRTRVQDLPLGPCYGLAADFAGTGTDTVLITREHKQGSLTVGVFFIDMLGYGLKDVFFRFNIMRDQFDRHFVQEMQASPLGYQQAEERVLNGYACARMMKNSMPKDFADTQYILEPGWRERYERKEYFDFLPDLARAVMDANPELARQAAEVAEEELARRQAE